MRRTMMATASVFALALSSAAFAAGTDQSAAGAAGTTGDTMQQQTGATGTTGMPEMGGQSYAELEDDERDGISFAAGQDDWEADDVIGASVVDADGEEIGEIEDLLVGEGDSIDRAVIRVSAEDGDEERYVVVRLDELQRAEGDDAEEFTLVRTAIDGDYFMGESSFEKQDGQWEPSSL